jgi:hypothetical protein
MSVVDEALLAERLDQVGRALPDAHGLRQVLADFIRTAEDPDLVHRLGPVQTARYPGRP